jgi:5'(3')-deoxyribonucleotidase
MIKTFTQFINEAEKKADIKFYVDMDGVLADFDAEVDGSPSGEAHKEALTKVREWTDKNLPDVKWRQMHDIKHYGEKYPELKKLYKEANDLVMKEAKQKGFFRRLKVMDGAKELLKTAKEITGQLPSILTACVDSPYCEQEKEIWMKENLPGMYDSIHYEQDKEKYAGSEADVLIDDRQKNVELFKKAGGRVIHHYGEDPTRTIKMMKELSKR